MPDYIAHDGWCVGGGGKFLSIRYTQMALTVFSKLFVFKESYLCFFPEIKTKVQSFYLLINSG